MGGWNQYEIPSHTSYIYETFCSKKYFNFIYKFSDYKMIPLKFPKPATTGWGEAKVSQLETGTFKYYSNKKVKGNILPLSVKVLFTWWDLPGTTSEPWLSGMVMLIELVLPRVVDLWFVRLIPLIFGLCVLVASIHSFLLLLVLSLHYYGARHVTALKTIEVAFCGLLHEIFPTSSSCRLRSFTGSVETVYSSLF